MNEYKIFIKGTDIFGVQFLKNVIEYTQKGAVLCNDHAIVNKWPHTCVMQITTEDDLVGDMTKGVEVVATFTPLTREQLDELDWETFKSVCRKHFGITGKARDLMSNKYVKSVEERKS